MKRWCVRTVMKAQCTLWGQYLFCGMVGSKGNPIEFEWEKLEYQLWVVNPNFDEESYCLYPQMSLKEKFAIFWLTWMDRVL